jgi:hypothetical protein
MHGTQIHRSWIVCRPQYHYSCSSPLGLMVMCFDKLLKADEGTDYINHNWISLVFKTYFVVWIEFEQSYFIFWIDLLGILNRLTSYFRILISFVFYTYFQPMFACFNTMKEFASSLHSKQSVPPFCVESCSPAHTYVLLKLHVLRYGVLVCLERVYSSKGDEINLLRWAFLFLRTQILLMTTIRDRKETDSNSIQERN